MIVPNVCDSIVIALFIGVLAFEIRVTSPLVEPVPEVVIVNTVELATVTGVKTAPSSPVPEIVPEVKSCVTDKPEIVEFKAVPPSTSILMSSVFMLPSPEIDALYVASVSATPSSCKSSPSVEDVPLYEPEVVGVPSSSNICPIPSGFTRYTVFPFENVPRVE